MHRLKRNARYQSWYPDEDGQTTINPFSKVRNTTRRRQPTISPEGGEEQDGVVNVEERFERPTLQRVNAINVVDVEEHGGMPQALPPIKLIAAIPNKLWVILLLPFIPAGFAVQYTGQSATAIFAINFVAIVPLSVLLGIVSDDLTVMTGNVVGALVNSAFSNAVQLITSILLLKNDQIRILQTALVGSILSNMHLTLGLGFVFGGLDRMQQIYNAEVGQLFGTMLLLAMASLIVPSVLGLLDAKVSQADVLRLSRAIAVVLLISYGVFLYFSLKSHAKMFDDPYEWQLSVKGQSRQQEIGAHRWREAVRKKEANKVIAYMSTAMGAAAINSDVHGAMTIPKSHRAKPAIVSRVVAIAVLTALLGCNTTFATDSLDGLIEQTGLTPTFIGITVLPLLSVDFTILSQARHNEMDLFISLTVGKCLQTALLIIPIIVLLGWILNNGNMSLSFDPFEVVALFASVMYINSIIQEGKSN
ncbi:hypothetical protein MMC10_006670 [Thelotrema lepadinum]|nr:hypothetical protein [Thelotrema lepadinum]